MQHQKQSSSKSSEYLLRPSGVHAVSHTYHPVLEVKVYYPSSIHFAQGDLYPKARIDDIKAKISSIPGIPEAQIAQLDELRGLVKKGLPLQAGKFSVLIFSAGSGSSDAHYQNLIADCVSQGYIVVAKDYFDEKKSPQVAAKEIVMLRQKLIELPKDDFLLAAMNLAQVGLMGHSAGGVASLLAASQQPKLFQAVTALDAPADRIGYIIAEPKEIDPATLVERDDGFPRFYSMTPSKLYFVDKEALEPMIELDAKHLSLLKVRFTQPLQELLPTDSAFIQAQTGHMVPTLAYDVTQGAPIPTLQIHARSWEENYRGLEKQDFKLKANQHLVILAPLNADSVFYSDHNNFQDFSTLQYQPAIRGANQYLIEHRAQFCRPFMKMYSPMQVGIGDGWQIAQSVHEYIHQFFNYHLKRKPQPIFTLGILPPATQLSSGHPQPKTLLEKKPRPSSSMAAASISVGLYQKPRPVQSVEEVALAEMGKALFVRVLGIK